MKQQVNWRRILLIYLAGGLILAALWFGFRSYLQTTPVSLSASAGPHLLVEEIRHDFGRVPAGRVLRHEFRVANDGSSRAVLNRQFCTTCGDLEGSGTTIVPAGGQAVIPVEMKTDGRNGTLKQMFVLTTSDSQCPRIELMVTADVFGE